MFGGWDWIRKGTMKAIERDTTAGDRSSVLATTFEELRVVLDASQEGLCLEDVETGHIIFTNDAADAILGRPRADILGRRLDELVHLPDDTAPRDDVRVEAEIRQPGGVTRVAELLSRPIKLGGCDLCVTSLRDVTERKRAEEQREGVRRLAALSMWARVEFLGELEHDLLTPLNGILGFAECLDASPLTRDQRHDLDLLVDSAEQLREAIENALNLIELDRRGWDVQYEPVDLSRLIEQKWRRAATRARLLEQRIILERPSTLPRVVRSDGAILATLIRLYIDHGIHSVGERGSLRLRVDVTTSSDGGDATLLMSSTIASTRPIDTDAQERYHRERYTLRTLQRLAILLQGAVERAQRDGREEAVLRIPVRIEPANAIPADGSKAGG